MFYPIDNLSSYWNTFWGIYGEDILALSDKWYNNEAIHGTSCKQYKVYQYYLAFYLGVLIKAEIDNGQEVDYDYFNTKYGLDDKKNKLACNNISLDEVLSSFGIAWEDNTGIEGMGIEENFIVEPDYTLPTPTVDVAALMATPDYCLTIYNECEL